MSDKEMFIGALVDYSKMFLPTYDNNDIEQTSKDLIDNFVENMKSVGLKRLVKGGIVTGLSLLGEHIFGNEGYSTLETVCQIGAVGGTLYTLSTLHGLIGTYWNKKFLHEIAPTIVRNYYLTNAFRR